MTEFLRPGVFPQEVAYDAYVRSVPTSTFGVVGVFQKGPVGVATLVTSLAEAQSIFGAYLSTDYAMLSLKAYFENGGGRAYVVRTCHYVANVSQASASTITLSDRNGVPANTLQVSASSPGVWGDDLSVEVVASTAYPTTGFNLLVKSDAGVVLETFKDLLIGSVNAGNVDHVEQRINGVSAYVKVTDLYSATAAANNRPALGTSALASGNDGLASIAAADFVGNSTALNGIYALSTVPVNFVAIPGEADATAGPTINAGIITFCEARKVFGILEAPQGSTATTLVDFRSGTGTYVHTAFNSSYAGIYGPWLDGEHPTTGRAIKLPPAGFVAGVFARTDSREAVWAAPAGLNRGYLLGATAPETLWTDGQADVLYNAGVNPVWVQSNILCVYGQKTLQIKASATDRVNVRRLMMYLEKSITEAANFFVFEANTPATWNAFKRLVNPFLQRTKDEGGLTDFLVVVDDTINTPAVIAANTMKVRILVKPTLTAEYIPIEFALAAPGANLVNL